VRATKLFDLPGPTDIVAVNYEPNRLVISITPSLLVTFTNVYGFRVLDERDLLEFWPACAASNGGIFEVAEGGWLCQENERSGFLTGRDTIDIKEYLVTGLNDCVNVFAIGAPLLSRGV
jgi:hypothetical protein